MRRFYRYRDWVVRVAFRFTRNRDDALEVLQEVLAYLLKRLPDLYVSARMTTFLYPVTKHCAIDLIRKRERYVSIDDSAEVRFVDPASTKAVDREDLAVALSVLSTDQRETLLMRYVDDMQLGDIAEVLGIPVGTVKSRIHNALKALRTDPRTRRYFQP